MTKKWFTIMFENPEKCIKSRHKKQNCICQWLYRFWMYLQTFQDSCVAAEKFSKKCGVVYLFVGKDAGRLVRQFINGKEID